MNILLVASDNSISSGAFNSLTFLAKELKKNKHNVYVTIPYKGNGVKLLEENEIKYLYIKSYDWIGSNNTSVKYKIVNGISRLKMLYNIIPYFKYRKLLKEYEIDLVHNNTSYTYIAAKASISNKTKLVWHIREFLEEDQNNKFLFKKYSHKLMNKSNKIICISNKIYEKYSKYLKNDKMNVIYNGVDINKYYIENKTIFNKPSVSLLCVGGVTERKGQFELAEAVSRLKSENKYDVNLKLVGDYSPIAKERIDDIQKKYNVNCIELLGKRSDIPKFYNDADIVFMCSVSEAFGRVTVEGMFSGCLVIGKDCAATSEILKHQETGLLYNDVESLIANIKYAIDNKEESRIIAKKGQEYAKNRFTSEKNANEIIKVYEELMEDRNE